MRPDNRAGRSKIVCDPVHGFIELPEDMFYTLIDTPLIQRLRDIRQLGLTEYIYPGARHSRFEHSLGAAHVMKTAIKKIISNTRQHVLPYLDPATGERLEEILERLEEITWEAVTAALLHDLGHIMLSHVAEAALTDPLLLKPPYNRMTVHAGSHRHEEITLHTIELVLSNLGKTGAWPSAHGRRLDLDVVKEILSRAYTPRESPPDASPRDEAVTLAAYLVSSDIDVDRADYILRDSKHTGAVEGLYGLERLYEVAVVVPYTIAGTTRWALGVIDKGIPVVENMLLSRVFMYNDVYLHPVSLVYDSMAARLLALVYLLPPQVREKCMVAECMARAYEDYATLDEHCLLILTDSGFNTLLHRIPLLLRDAGTILDALTGAGLDEETGCRHLVALEALSKALVSRRHPPALIAEGRTAAVIAGKMHENDMVFLEKVRDRVDPLLMLSASLYYGYKPKEGRELRVFLRNAGLAVKFHEADKAVLAQSLAEKRYARAVIVSPQPPVDGGMHAGWNIKRGSYTIDSRMVSENVLGACSSHGLSRGDVDELIRESSLRAAALAQELSTLASQITG